MKHDLRQTAYLPNQTLLVSAVLSCKKACIHPHHFFASSRFLQVRLVDPLWSRAEVHGGRFSERKDLSNLVYCVSALAIYQ